MHARCCAYYWLSLDFWHFTLQSDRFSNESLTFVHLRFPLGYAFYMQGYVAFI
jgi:hypothetical protein